MNPFSVLAKKVAELILYAKKMRFSNVEMRRIFLMDLTVGNESFLIFTLESRTFSTFDGSYVSGFGFSPFH